MRKFLTISARKYRLIRIPPTGRDRYTTPIGILTPVLIFFMAIAMTSPLFTVRIARKSMHSKSEKLFTYLRSPPGSRFTKKVIRV